MNWKRAYTKIFLKEQGKSANDVTIKEFMPLWWKNTRDKGEGGLRLTDAGLDLINEIDLATYDVPYPKDMPVSYTHLTLPTKA